MIEKNQTYQLSCRSPNRAITRYPILDQIILRESSTIHSDPAVPRGNAFAQLACFLRVLCTSCEALKQRCAHGALDTVCADQDVACSRRSIGKLETHGRPILGINIGDETLAVVHADVLRDMAKENVVEFGAVHCSTSSCKHSKLVGVMIVEDTPQAREEAISPIKGTLIQNLHDL